METMPSLCQGQDCEVRNECLRYTDIPKRSQNIIGEPWKAWHFCRNTEYRAKSYPFFISNKEYPSI